MTFPVCVSSAPIAFKLALLIRKKIPTSKFFMEWLYMFIWSKHYTQLTCHKNSTLLCAL